MTLMMFDLVTGKTTLVLFSYCVFFPEWGVICQILMVKLTCGVLDYLPTKR